MVVVADHYDFGRLEIEEVPLVSVVARRRLRSIRAGDRMLNAGLKRREEVALALKIVQARDSRIVEAFDG